MVGSGWPLALQESETLEPSFVTKSLPVLARSTIFGGTKRTEAITCVTDSFPRIPFSLFIFKKSISDSSNSVYSPDERNVIVRNFLNDLKVEVKVENSSPLPIIHFHVSFLDQIIIWRDLLEICCMKGSLNCWTFSEKMTQKKVKEKEEARKFGWQYGTYPTLPSNLCCVALGLCWFDLVMEIYSTMN